MESALPLPCVLARKYATSPLGLVDCMLEVDLIKMQPAKMLAARERWVRPRLVLVIVLDIYGGDGRHRSDP